MIRKYQTPSPTITHPDGQVHPMLLSMKGRSCRCLHGSKYTAIALYALLRHPEFSLGNKVTHPNGAAIMLLWWSKMTIIFTLG